MDMCWNRIKSYNIIMESLQVQVLPKVNRLATRKVNHGARVVVCPKGIHLDRFDVLQIDKLLQHYRMGLAKLPNPKVINPNT